jgi:hypothetical protein
MGGDSDDPGRIADADQGFLVFLLYDFNRICKHMRPFGKRYGSG